ncbi:galactonate dehydratase [Streptomyces sp. ALI-76-A]|uniref:galactonate dehydratase n=1 Tax=Streptomyces sp. ALI-76-A TaxID=3025736 RepID=UPI00256EB575|nr:galactonate dehydratase [Streptomyces sp. ALI-76-A]MDL5199822.1 galactonate dehydratase [Streptomyces sp. ALI-76-A]
MQITGLETFLVAPRWLFLRVATDEGITGWGEPVIEGRAETVRAAVHELADHLVGQDPLRIEDHWQVLTKGGFYRGGPILSSAVAGIDQALWDIAGKTYGVPVHRLLGGPVRDRVRMYAWIGGDRPSDVAELAEAQVEAGFTAVKMNASAELASIGTPARTAEVIDRVAAVREVLGDERDIAVDFHGRVSTAMARRLLPLLEPLHPLFVEEPVLPEHSAHLRGLVESTSIPLVTGERLYSRWDFREVMTSGIAVAQPDLSHAGGISEVRRIAAMAVVVHGGYELAEGGRRVDDRFLYVDILSGRLFEWYDGTGRAPRRLARIDVPLGAVAPVHDRPDTWIAAAGTGIALLTPDGELEWLDRPRWAGPRCREGRGLDRSARP